jgi:hypothetical protein
MRSPSSSRAPGSYGDYLTDLWLLLGGVGDDQSRRGAGLRILSRGHHHPIAERLKLHSLRLLEYV